MPEGSVPSIGSVPTNKHSFVNGHRLAPSHPPSIPSPFRHFFRHASESASGHLRALRTVLAQGRAMHDRPCGCFADGMLKALLIIAPSTSADMFRRSLGWRLRRCLSNPPRPRAAQTIRKFHASLVARPHSQSLGSRPTPMPLLQSTHETRWSCETPRAHRTTPGDRRRFGRRRSRSPKGEPAGRGGRFKPWSQSNHPGRRSRNGSLTTNPTSTGSTVPGIHPIPIRTASTNARHGRHLKSDWTTVARWFSNTPDKQEAHPPKNRRQKKSWHSGP